MLVAADPISTVVLKIVKRDCPANTCPYRQGDGVHQRRAAEKLDKGLKHRVADGKEVRKLEARLETLTKVLTRVLAAGRNRKLNPQEVASIERALQIEQS